MASGKTHAAVSLIAALPTGLAVSFMLGPVAGISAAAGCLTGIPMTPDLDQVGISHSEWALVKKLGPLGFLWMALWWPYAKIFPHRSFWSHFPVIGTALRLAYVAIIGGVTWLALGRPALPSIPSRPAEGFVIGLATSDTLHWLMDKCPV